MRRLSVACVLATALAPPSFAHHSAAAYDRTKLVTVEGTVTALAWKNPHVSMTVETQGPDGAQLRQEIEVMSVAQARGLGLHREAISPGQHVVVRAMPNRRGPTERAFGISVTTSDGAVMPLSSFARLSTAPAPGVEARGIAGRWVPTVESFATDVAAAAAAPVTEAGRVARAEALRWYTAPDGTGVGICTPLIPPLLHVFPDLRTIEVSTTRVVIRSETNGMMQERVVHLDRTSHPASLAPTTEGHSIGRWDAESLVIDTVGFAPSQAPDLVLLPTLPDTHLVEKLTLAPDRRHLEYEFTIDVPGYLTEPATFRATWDHRPELEPSNEVCDPETAQRQK